MKRNSTRILSFLIALIMVLSLLPAAVFAAEPSVNYVTETTVLNEKGSASGYTNVVKNWGKRGQLATFVSPMAEDFYGNLTYSTLSGYSATQLKNLMAGNYPITDYDDCKFLLSYTDCQENGYYISGFYSGTDILPVWDGGASWNREHTWPQSKSAGGNNDSIEEDDIVMIRPASSKVNSSRNNTAYGESDGYYNPNGHTTVYDLRGDVARSMIYGYVRWDMTTIWGNEGVIESQEVLLKWMREDPVDTWEMGRNDSIQSITGTRNVFVDYPELAFTVLGAAVPTTMNTPSGAAMKISYTVTATSNNESYGTVHVNGNTITAFPKQGYTVENFEVLSGSPSTTLNGNVMIVDRTCSVRVNFTEAVDTTVYYIHNGTVANTQSADPGAVIFMPQYTGSSPEGYTFFAWVDAPTTPSAQTPAKIYKPGDAYTVKTGINNIYALYTFMDDSVSGEQYQLVTSSTKLKVNDKVVVVAVDAQVALSTEQKNNNRGTTPITRNADGTVVSWTGEAVQILTLHTGTVSDCFGLYTGSGYLYAAGNSGSNLLRTGSLNDNASWKITVDSGNVATVKAQGTNTNNWMRYNNSGLFSCYGPTNTQKDINLYVAVATGTTMYTTGVGGCSHSNTVNTPAVDATCTATGYTAGVQCADCLTYLQGHTVTQPLGHNYKYTVIEPTYDEMGYTVGRCSRCGDTTMSDFTDALKDVHTISFATPNGVDTIDSITCGKSGAVLPEAEAPNGYNFLGWTDAPITDATAVPSYTKAGITYKPTADTTLYALYSYAVGGSGETSYEKTDLSQITASDVVIITMTYGTTTYALNSANGSSSAPTATIITISGNKATAGVTDAILWNIKTDNGSYTFSPAGDSSKYLYCTNTNNGVRVGTSANKQFTLDADTGYLKNTGTNRYLGVYTTNPDWRCYTSTTTNIKQQTLNFFAQKSAGTIYYTTLNSSVTEPTGVAIYAGNELIDEYDTLAAALANYDVSGEYIKLLGNINENVTLDDSVYIDLNGYTLSGTMNTEGNTVYGIDTTTDNYTCADMGYFDCVDEDGKTVVPQILIYTNASRVGAAKRYVALETEDGYTFHRFYLGITHATLKPTVKGIGYKAVFAGDDMVKAAIDSYGYTMQLGENDAITRSKTGSEFVSMDTVTLRVDNYDAENFGTTELDASVFMVIAGQTVTGTTYTITLKSMVEQINDLTTLTADQKSALYSWIATSKTIQTWDVGNLYTN